MLYSVNIFVFCIVEDVCRKNVVLCVIFEGRPSRLLLAGRFMTIDFQMLDFLVLKAHGVICFETFAICVGHTGSCGFCYLLQFFFSRSSGFPKINIDSSEQITSSSAFCWSLTFLTRCLHRSSLRYGLWAQLCNYYRFTH